MQEKASYSMTHDPVDIHGALETVRQSNEFKPNAEQDPLEQLRNHPQVREFLDALQSTLETMVDAIRSFFSELPIPKPNADAAFLDQVFIYALYGVMVFLLLFVFYVLLVVARQFLMHRRKSVLPSRVTSEGVLLESVQAHRSRATALADAQQFGPAVHQLYLATLCLLDESRRVPFETYRTNREYLEEPGLADSPASARSDFSTVARQFEAVHYGHLPLEEGDYTACRDAFESLLALGKSEAKNVQ